MRAVIITVRSEVLVINFDLAFIIPYWMLDETNSVHDYRVIDDVQAIDPVPHEL